MRTVDGADTRSRRTMGDVNEYGRECAAGLRKRGYVFREPYERRRYDAALLAANMIPYATILELANKWECLVCMDSKGRILGALFSGGFQERQGDGCFEYVRALAVRREHQRRGIGSALLWKLGEVCGSTPMIGKCNPGTEPFYVRNGFHLLPECPVAGIDRHRPPTGGAPWFTSDPDIGKNHD